MGTRHRGTLDIEDAVRWAIRELSNRNCGGTQGPSSPSNPLARHLSLGTKIDNWARQHGLQPAAQEPHPDAVLIRTTVGNLDWAALDLREFAITHRLSVPPGDAKQMLEVQRREAVTHVLKYALHGRPPVALERVVEPVRLSQTGKVAIWHQVRTPYDLGNGQTGWTTHDAVVKKRKKDDYPPGSFAKIAFIPECQDIAHDRAVYAVWWAALSALADILKGQLSSMDVCGPAAPRAPWLCAAVDEGTDREPYRRRA